MSPAALVLRTALKTYLVPRLKPAQRDLDFDALVEGVTSANYDRSNLLEKVADAVAGRLLPEPAGSIVDLLHLLHYLNSDIVEADGTPSVLH